MKVTFDLDKPLYDKVVKNGRKNERSMGAEIRFQLKKCYEKDRIQE